MFRCLAASSIVLLSICGSALAETCDAGNGCSITCADGCSAVYNHDTGGCSTSCSEASFDAESLAASPQKLKCGRMTGAFRDAPQSEIDKQLKSLRQPCAGVTSPLVSPRKI